MMDHTPRHDWTLEALQNIYHMPLFDLLYEAATVHRHYHKSSEVQLCKLISVKTGGCSEDCRYCAQSSYYDTPVKAQPMLRYEEVMADAKKAIDSGATRICLGAAWREVRDSKQFDQILEMVKGITAMGAEVCCTLGMLKEHQAVKLAEAGLYAYNHNLDSSRDYYPNVSTTRTYDERLNTLETVEKAGISVCCGGILGLGETVEDRLKLIHTLATRPKHPGSVPINLLEKIPGTPFKDNKEVSTWEMVRTIATARIVLPQAMLRLSGGRNQMSLEQQALYFSAGANSIFVGDKLLTVANPAFDADAEMFRTFGLSPRPPFAAENEVADSACCGGCH
jgi:biotin synthase